MERVFGLPAGPLALWLTGLLFAAAGAITVLGFRNRVFVKMGLRNIPRRRARSALIVLGLMLATMIIASSLLTGDTMASAVRAATLRSLGPIDEAVTGGTHAESADMLALAAAKPYFPAAPAVGAVDDATATLPVDGVAAVIIEPVAAQHAAGKRTEPRLTLFAPDTPRASRFGFPDLSTLGDEVLLNPDAAKELRASPGSTITILTGNRRAEVRVAGIGDFRGTTTTGSAAIMPLAAAQRLLDRAGQANHVLVSNTGTETSGVVHTEEVERAVDTAVAPLGLDAQPTKRDGLDTAETTGNVFVQLFTTFGSFAMAAGILLIFLIFVMLSTERRPEMGMARAVGTQRRHLVQTFLYEGATYDLVAAAIGALLGIGISWVMVHAVASAFTTEGFDLDLGFTFSARSVIIAYAIGVLLTFVVVTLSAWRVSRLNIVSAIRDLPEPAGDRHRRSHWLGVAGGVGIGTLMAVSGATGKAYLPWMLGVSIVIISVVPIAKVIGRSERLAYTAAGGFLLVWWMLPLSTFDVIFGKMSKDFSVWITSGLVIVVAATWLVTYNADLLLGFVARLASPFRGWRPVAKMAVAYPLRSRFRTAVTMAMFMLVVFTLVTGSTIPTAFMRSFDNVERFGGGYEVRVSTAPAAATDDLRRELPGDIASDITATGAQSFVPVEARQGNEGTSFERYALRGLDGAFLEHTTYELAAMARGYGGPREVWKALASTPGLAVVDPFVAPRRDQWGFAVRPDFQLHGFYLEDRAFEPVPVQVHDPLTNRTIELTVIGVLSDNTPLTMAGITVSQDTLAPFGDRALPTVHHLAVRDGADPGRVADAVEAALLTRGAEAKTYQALLDEAVGGSMLFIRLVQGFMALGLVVGVAALGVISARAVVERRQQLGMLRAIGFQPELIRRTLLTETSIIAITAIVAGSLLGLLLSYNVIADAGDQLGNADVTFAVPWVSLAVVFTAVVLAALLTTMLSALRASRIYPAEALRYQ